MPGVETAPPPPPPSTPGDSPLRWDAGAQPNHWRVVCAPCRLRLPELKQSVSQALDYHRLLFQEIAERPVQHDRLGDAMGGAVIGGVDADRLRKAIVATLEQPRRQIRTGRGSPSSMTSLQP